MAVAFCTCTELSCPFNPANHSQGCTPCIAKNLREREIPTCFFKAVGYPKPTEEWHYEDFAALIRAAQEAKGQDGSSDAPLLPGHKPESMEVR